MNKKLYFQQSAQPSDFKFKRAPFEVGIHGIRGSFNDEAWSRFVKENLKIKEEFWKNLFYEIRKKK